MPALLMASQHGSQHHQCPQRYKSATFESGHNTKGADLYLWGHWWCCESCWNVMISAGIRNVYLLENSEILFNKANADNIVGHQF